jgi:hypothetical protein
MVMLRRALIGFCLIAVVVFAWLWWTRPLKADMSAYVPADSILYVEADSLPDIFGGLTSTAAWRELAPAAGVETNSVGPDWLRRLVSFTGAGPGEAVILARAQVAVTVVGFEAEEESDTTLKFSPRAALVAETHTSEWRVKAAAEKIVGDFARHSFGSPTVERKEVDGVPFVIWSAPSGSHRKIVTAVAESVAVIGNDEGAVRECLEVRRGARASLSGNEQLKEMRARLGAEGALAFGFAPQGSAAKMVEVFAPAFVGGVSPETKVQSLLATVLPQLINQTLGSAGWSSRVVDGSVEDRFFLALPGDMSQRLQAPLAAARGSDAVAGLLPPNIYQVSRYNFSSPELAWRGLGAALSSQVDVSRATLITLALEALLKPYGIEQPREFLRACGPEIATVKLSNGSESKLLIAAVSDPEALRKLVRAHLGSARVQRVGDVELLVSNDPERGASSFVEGFLLMGAEDDVRRCLAARAEKKSLGNSEAYQPPGQDFFPEPAFVQTLTDERDSVRSVVPYVARLGGTRDAANNPAALDEVVSRRPLSVSATRLAEGGFEKKTRSSFGLFGEIISRLGPR